MPKAGRLTINERNRVQPGYVLYSPYAGTGFTLLDRDANVVHQWPVGRYTKVAELLPSGNLLYARMRDGVFEATWDNEPVWSYRCRQHHDFCRRDNGNVLVLMNEFTFNARAWHGAIDKADALVEVNRAGEVVWEFHFSDHVDQLADLAELSFPRKQEDWAHTNTVELLPDSPLGRRDSRFRSGNVLFSCRNLHTIGVVDYATGDVVWAWGPGELDGQHMPTMLPEGNLLVYDNGTSRGYSRVVELDPGAGEVVWEYRVPDYAFARALSGAELLPNGNLLLCNGNPGVLQEVTRKGEIVWELHNEIRGLRDSYAVAVYRAMFCSSETVEPHLAA